MPIFEYKCQECGSRFERIVTASSPSVVCRSCESANVEKQLSVFAVATGSHASSASEAGPCDTCGARERGMCQGGFGPAD